MKITVIAVGKLKEKFWRDACDEYTKRLGRYTKIVVRELNDCDLGRYGGEKQAREAEAEQIVKALPGESGGSERFIVCLDSRGWQPTSEEFSEFVDARAIDGCKDLVFVIGGPTGIDEKIKSMANGTLSFGKITLPHNLARVVLLEQVYRAFKISKGEPYHK